MVPPPWRRRIQQSANMLCDKSMSFKIVNMIVFTIFISYFKAWRIVSTRCACVYRLLLDGMIMSRACNRPNRSNRVFRAGWMFYMRESRRNELVEGGHRRPLSSEILPWWEHDMQWWCRPKRVPIRERRLRAWYYLRRNLNLYEIGVVKPTLLLL